MPIIAKLLENVQYAALHMHCHSSLLVPAVPQLQSKAAHMPQPFQHITAIRQHVRTAWSLVLHLDCVTSMPSSPQSQSMRKRALCPIWMPQIGMFSVTKNQNAGVGIIVGSLIVSGNGIMTEPNLAPQQMLLPTILNPPLPLPPLPGPNTVCPCLISHDCTRRCGCCLKC